MQELNRRASVISLTKKEHMTLNLLFAGFLVLNWDLVYLCVRSASPTNPTDSHSTPKGHMKSLF